MERHPVNETPIVNKIDLVFWELPESGDQLWILLAFCLLLKALYSCRAWNLEEELLLPPITTRSASRAEVIILVSTLYYIPLKERKPMHVMDLYGLQRWVQTERLDTKKIPRMQFPFLRT
jgi:hypothetical protein